MTCVARLMSPISSRNSVPPSASSKRPFLRCSAPVNAPLLVAEQLRLDQAVGQRGTAHFDERLVGARRVVVNRVRDHLLAGSRLAPDEHGGVGRRHLRHLLVHLPDRSAAADDAREVVAFPQLLPQVHVLVDQLLLVFLDQALDFDRLRDARRHDAVELHAAVVVAIGIELQVDGQRADRAPVEQDRHADEAQLLFRQLTALRRAVEEGRLLAHPRHDDRLAALDDLADDPFADAVADGVRRGVETVRRLDVQLAVVPQQGHHAAHGPVVLREDLEHAMQRRSQVQRAGERLADFEQRRQPPRLPRVGRRRRRPPRGL